MDLSLRPSDLPPRDDAPRDDAPHGVPPPAADPEAPALSPPSIGAAQPALHSDLRLGLALGGGGMKGWAHVGVLAELERLGLRPGIVAASSAGALIGAYYAFGYSLDDMVRLMREQRTASLFSLRFDGLGLLNNDALGDYLREHLDDCSFADLRVPFYVVCTDLETGREVIIREGSVVDALLASSAIPGIFAPVEIGGRLLVDGGLCNNVPVSVLVSHGAQYTLAIRLHQDGGNLHPRVLRRARAETDRGPWTDRLARSIRRENGHLPNGIEVVNRAMDIVISQIEGFRLQACPPDVLVVPDVSGISGLAFSEEKEAIFEAGVDAARREERSLRELESLLAGGPRQVASRA